MRRLFPFLFILLFCIPSRGYCIDVNVNISNLQTLIQQLQDAANNVVGSAGVQVRQSIDELSNQVAQRITQIDTMGTSLLNTATSDINKILDSLTTKVQALLVQVNNMVKGDIRCISAELAQTISQVTDGVTNLLNQLDQVLSQVIDQAYIRANQLIATGTGSIALTVDSVFDTIAKVVIVILIFILLFWLIRNLWLGKFPNSPALKFGIPGLLVVIVGGLCFLLFSPTALASIIGTKVNIPVSAATCNQADSLYNGFIQSYNNNAEKVDAGIVSLGNKAVEQLSLCQYTSSSASTIADDETKINAINALLFPPPPPPGTSGNPADTACANTPSVPPASLSGFNAGKLGVLATLKASHVITAKNLITLSPSEYSTLVERNSRARVMTTAVPRQIQPIEVGKMNTNVAKALGGK